MSDLRRGTLTSRDKKFRLETQGERLMFVSFVKGELNIVRDYDMYM